MSVSGLLAPAVVVLADAGNAVGYLALLESLPEPFKHKIYVFGHYLNSSEENGFLQIARKKNLALTYISAGHTYDYEEACFQTGFDAKAHTLERLADLLPGERFAAVVTDLLPNEWNFPNGREAYKTQYAKKGLFRRKKIRIYDLDFIRKQKTL